MDIVEGFFLYFDCILLLLVVVTSLFLSLGVVSPQKIAHKIGTLTMTSAPINRPRY